MSNVYMTGKTKLDRQRKVKKYDQGRVCKQDDCIVQLSMYNKKTLCFNHSPKSYGRVRGHIDPRTKD